MRPLLALSLAALLSSGCSKGCPDDFHLACARKGCVASVQARLKADRSLATKPNERGWFPLNLAADKAVAEALLEAGAEVDAVAGTQRTPIFDAIEADRGDVVAVLLARGAKIYDKAGALRDCAKRGKAKAAEALIDSGVPVDPADPSTQATPLLMAVLNDQLAAAELFLKRGANPDVTLSAGSQVWSMAGASANFKATTSDAGGSTILQLARSDAMRELLKKAGAK